MPTSNLHVAPYVINMVEQVPHRHVLDVGPGWGKYAVLLREYLNVKPERIDAVEAWEPYIGDHELWALYRRVWHGAFGAHGDAVWAVPVDEGGIWTYRTDSRVRDVLAEPDLVLMVDVLEHMTEADATAALELAAGRVVICTPLEFFDNGPDLPPTEEHVSHWTEDSIHALAHDTDRTVESYAERDGAVLARLSPRQR